MPNIKNTFVKGKMNKDLDARLMPNGEYRDSVNIQVINSEGSDVGAAQSVNSNTRLASSLLSRLITSLGNTANRIQVIGFHVDNTSNRFFWFVTNYNPDPNNTDLRADEVTSDADGTAGGSLYCAIFEQSESGDEATCLVKGKFLNFSKIHHINNVNVIGDLLFWTDNRNQPRKINIASAVGSRSAGDLNPTFYTTEDQISVAKYYPWKAPQLIKSLNTFSTGAFNLDNSSSQTFTLNYTNKHTKAVTNGMKLYFIVSGAEYNSTVTANPTDNGSAFTVQIGPLLDSSGVAVSSAVAIAATTELRFISVSTSMVEAPSNENVDPDYLKERFVKFAYRFKFVDNEYSVISPFSQTCFIPEFYKPSSAGAAPNLTDGGIDGTEGSGIHDNEEIRAFKNTELEKMVNYINKLDLFVDLEYKLKDLYTNLHITHIEIIMSEANNSTLRSIVSKEVKTDTTDHSMFSHTYESTLPYKVLPEDEVVRVFDNVPVQAATQDIVGNRLVYGNIKLGHDLPSSIDYSVSTQERTSTEYNLPTEYPTQTLKQRRTYQVGLVLADRYGRQSSVILPDTKNNTVFLEEKSHLGDTNSAGYDDGDGYCLAVTFNSTIPSNTLYSATNPLGWYSYKIVVKQTEQEYYNVYAPGLISAHPNGNERTWLTLHGDNINKVPRSLEGSANPDILLSPSDAVLFPKVINTANSGTFSNIGTITNFKDINVISIGTQKDHALFMGTGTDNSNLFFEPEKNHLLAELPDLSGSPYTIANVVEDADIEPNTVDDNTDPLGNNKIKLTVLETEPFESALDIYYETSTSGLVSELNEDIPSGAAGEVASLEINNAATGFAESVAANTFTNITIKAKNASGTVITSNVNISVNINDLNGNAIPSTAQPSGGALAVTADSSSGSPVQTLKVVSPWYYDNNGNSKKFNLHITATGPNNSSVQTTQQVNLTNVPVSLSNASGHFSPASTRTMTGALTASTLITKATANNGTAASGGSALNINYSLVSVNYGGTTYTSGTIFNKFSMGTTNGELRIASNLVGGLTDVGTYTFVIKARDTRASLVSTDEDTEQFVLVLNASGTYDFWFLAHDVKKLNEQIASDLTRDTYKKGYSALEHYTYAYNSSSTDACYTSSGSQMHIAWNYPTADHTTINGNRCQGTDTNWHNGIIIPNENSTSNTSVHQFYYGDTQGNTTKSLFALKSEQDANVRLLRCGESATDEDDNGFRDVDVSFNSIEIWIDDTTVLNSISPTSGTPTKKVKVNLIEENPSGDRTIIANLFHMATSSDKPERINHPSDASSPSGQRVRLNKFKVSSSLTNKNLTTIIENAAKYQKNSSGNSGLAAYSPYSPSAYSILGSDDYSGADQNTPDFMMREKYIYNLRISFEDV